MITAWVRNLEIETKLVTEYLGVTINVSKMGFGEQSQQTAEKNNQGRRLLPIERLSKRRLLMTITVAVYLGQGS